MMSTPNESVGQALDAVATASGHLLLAMDNGYLDYKPDSPESAFVASLRRALEDLGEARLHQAAMQLMQVAA
jgi:hypothetical protein